MSNPACCNCSNEFQEKVLPHEMPHLTGIKVGSIPHSLPLPHLPPTQPTTGSYSPVTPGTSETPACTGLPLHMSPA